LEEIGHSKSHYTNDGSNVYQTITGVGTVEDIPNTTSPITYYFDMKVGGTGTYGTMLINHYDAVSTVLITEVAQ